MYPLLYTQILKPLVSCNFFFYWRIRSKIFIPLFCLASSFDWLSCLGCLHSWFPWRILYLFSLFIVIHLCLIFTLVMCFHRILKVLRMFKVIKWHLLFVTWLLHFHFLKDLPFFNTHHVWYFVLFLCCFFVVSTRLNICWWHSCLKMNIRKLVFDIIWIWSNQLWCGNLWSNVACCIF